MNFWEEVRKFKLENLGAGNRKFPGLGGGLATRLAGKVKNPASLTSIIILELLALRVNRRGHLEAQRLRGQEAKNNLAYEDWKS